MADRIRIHVTEAGLFRIETDAISEPNHENAEGMLQVILGKLGGKPSRELKPNADLSHAMHLHTQDGHTHQH